jgi:hypothetical protein
MKKTMSDDMPLGMKDAKEYGHGSHEYFIELWRSVYGKG